MVQNLNKFICTIFLFFLCTCFVYGQEGLTGKDIVRLSDDLMRGDTLQGSYAMTVITPAWQRKLELKVWSVGRDRTFIRILSPAKEAGIGTLRIGNNMWNYLPKVERTIKIPPSMMLQPWMGSDFANDDLVKESSIVNDYEHKILGEEDVSGDIAYKIELIPKPKAAVTWGKIILVVRKADFAPLREEYYKEDGALIKVLKYSMLKEMSGRVIPTLWTMNSMIKEGHQTAIKIINVEYNLPLDESIFGLDNLKRIQ